MATLHVRSVPDDLYARLHKLAQTQNRSLSAQVITLLNQALEQEEARKRQARILADVSRRRFTARAGVPDSLELLREDRQR